jgi:hypothetical protein
MILLIRSKNTRYSAKILIFLSTDDANLSPEEGMTGADSPKLNWYTTPSKHINERNWKCDDEYVTA